MWTNTSREDRYVGDRWLEGGNIYWGTELGADYVRRFACERGYLIRDLALMAAALDLLRHWGCDWRWFTMVPLTRTNSTNHLGENPHQTTREDPDVRDLYQSVLACLLPSVLETVFEGAWSSGHGIADINENSRRDFHPTPLEHVRYLDTVSPDLVTETGRAWMQICEDKAREGDLDWQQPNRPRTRL